MQSDSKDEEHWSHCHRRRCSTTCCTWQMLEDDSETCSQILKMGSNDLTATTEGAALLVVLSSAGGWCEACSQILKMRRIGLTATAEGAALHVVLGRCWRMIVRHAVRF